MYVFYFVHFQGPPLLSRGQDWEAIVGMSII